MKYVAETIYDVLVVDLGLPDQDGIALILTLRQVGVTAPILILSARRSVEERIKGLERADDYMTKPFALGELLARFAILRRDWSSGNSTPHLRVFDLELDLIEREVTRSGKPIPLTSQEFDLLEFLCRNAGQLVTRSMLWNGYGESGLSLKPMSSMFTFVACAGK